MTEEVLDISQFQRDDTFYPAIPLILTIKSFDLQAIRKRYLNTMGKKSGKVGSVERRTPGLGGVVSLTLDKGKLMHSSLLCEMKEPRGIDYQKGLLAIAAENEVMVFTGDMKKTIKNPWFSYIHTVQFNPFNSGEMVISSSGFDVFFEYNWQKGEQLFEWYAWEHGFNNGIHPDTGKPFYLTKDESTYKKLRGNADVLWIKDPLAEHLPTAMRAAFINSVCYDTEQADSFLATFFHEGKVYAIQKGVAKPVSVIEGLQSPHGGRRLGKGYMATSTRAGEIVLAQHDKVQRLVHCNLPGKPKELGEMEWVQNAIEHDGYIISIDSNRNSFIIVDMALRKYSMIPYNENWAVQDLVAGELEEGIVQSVK
jgi:hypothetical protein